MFISTAIHQMFAPEFTDDELDALLAGQENANKKEILIDEELLAEEDDPATESDTRNQIGNWMCE